MSKVEVEDVASALRGELHTRRFGAAAKLEVDKDCPPSLQNSYLIVSICLIANYLSWMDR